MRILILGASGLLGKALVQEWKADEIFPATSRNADIRNEAQVRKLVAECRPDWTILAAAYTDVDGCENNPALAHEVNGIGASNVARSASEHGSRLLLISTDYVFDGSKSTPYETDDPISPLGVYGRSKADAENIVRQSAPDCCIVRTSWLFGPQGRCFPNTILKLAQERKRLTVVSDQRGGPTYNRDLARVLIRLVHAGARGTIHAANAGDCSWFEFAQEIIGGAGLTGVPVAPILSAEMNRPAPRPRYSVFSCASLYSYGLTLRPWRQALDDYLREYVASHDPDVRALSSDQTGWVRALR